jgi:hypothetical protein
MKLLEGVFVWTAWLVINGIIMKLVELELVTIIYLFLLLISPWANEDFPLNIIVIYLPEA